MKHYNTINGFYERLQQLVYDKELTAKQVGEICGMERKTVYMWLNGDTMPNSNCLAKLCKALNVSADYMLFGKNNEIVHCKDCKHWGTGAAGETKYGKQCKYAGYFVGENGYCVYGESEV